MQSTIDTCIPDFNSVKMAILTLIIAKLFHLSTKILRVNLILLVYLIEVM